MVTKKYLKSAICSFSTVLMRVYELRDNNLFGWQKDIHPIIAGLREKCKVTLIIDNCPAQLYIELNFIKIAFLFQISQV